MKLSLAGEGGATPEREVDTEDGEAEMAGQKGPLSWAAVGDGVAEVAAMAAVVAFGMSWAPLAGPGDKLGAATRPGPASSAAAVLIGMMAAAFSGRLGVLDMRKTSGEDCEGERAIRKECASGKKKVVKILDKCGQGYVSVKRMDCVVV